MEHAIGVGLGLLLVQVIRAALEARRARRAARRPWRDLSRAERAALVAALRAELEGLRASSANWRAAGRTRLKAVARSVGLTPAALVVECGRFGR